MHETNQPYDIDHIYALMMDALDGPLSSEDQLTLDRALIANAELAAEWRAIGMVDDLLLQTPLVEPPAEFAARTIARLPNWRARRWAVVLAFVSALTVGMIPLLLLGLGILFGTDLGVAAAGFLQVVSAIVSGIGQILFESASLIGAYPAVMGAVLVMIGSVTLWSGLYQQLVVRPVPVTH